MIRLCVTVEGQAELAFVRHILAPHLISHNVAADARCVLTSRDQKTKREFRGGLSNYAAPKRDLQHWFKSEKSEDRAFTTMFDLYGLPNDFPGYGESKSIRDPYKRVSFLENQLADNLGEKRFIPYIQLHEFEALILAEPQALDWEFFDRDKEIEALITMIGNQNPEMINDGPNTSPSKRITAKIPEYAKAKRAMAKSVLEKIGLKKLRQRCPHFGEWLTQLEQLGQK